MSRIGKLIIEGFGSVIKEAEYNFDKTGLNIILGKNGAGKTTLLNALSWVIYGKLIKGKNVQPWPHLIDKHYKGTKVSLKFDDYEIIRCQDYSGKVLGRQGKNRLILLYLGKEVDVKLKGNIQPLINAKIGYTFDLFKTTVLFGQKLKRLMEETGPDKKKIFEEAFESAFISKAKDIVLKRQEGMEKDYAMAIQRVDNTKSEYKLSKSHLSELKTIITKFGEDKLAKILVIRKDLLFLKESIKLQKAQLENKNLPRLLRKLAKKMGKYENRVKELNQVKSEEFDLTLRINRSESDIESFKGKIKKKRQELIEIPKKCNKCDQPIPKDKRLKYKKSLSSDILDLVKQMGVEELVLKGLHDQYDAALAKIEEFAKDQIYLNKLKAKSLKLEKEKLKITQVEENIKVTWARINEKEEQIKKLQQEKPPVKDLKSKKKELKELKANLRKEIATKKSIGKKLDVDKWLLDKPLGNAGLKAYIFDSMMGLVNHCLKAYKQLIGFEVKIEVDMESANKDINILIIKEDDEIPYADLSGGEKQLVDVTIAFALSDTVNKSKPINILLMDEVFESLDLDNIEKVQNIVLAKSKTKAIHVITHKADFIPTHANMIALKKVKGHTKII